MGKVVNLNQFRKQKLKQARVKQAETNRRLHGRTKQERAQDALQKQRQERAIEGARLTCKPDDEKGAEENEPLRSSTTAAPSNDPETNDGGPAKS